MSTQGPMLKQMADNQEQPAEIQEGIDQRRNIDEEGAEITYENGSEEPSAISKGAYGLDKNTFPKGADPAEPNKEQAQEPGGFSLGHTRRNSTTGFEHLAEQVTTPLYQKKEVSGPLGGLSGRQASDRQKSDRQISIQKSQSYGSREGHGRASSQINADILSPAQQVGLVAMKSGDVGAKASRQPFPEAGTSSAKKQREQNATAEFFARGLDRAASGAVTGGQTAETLEDDSSNQQKKEGSNPKEPGQEKRRSQQIGAGRGAAREDVHGAGQRGASNLYLNTWQSAQRPVQMLPLKSDRAAAVDVPKLKQEHERASVSKDLNGQLLRTIHDDENRLEATAQLVATGTGHPSLRAPRSKSRYEGAASPDRGQEKAKVLTSLTDTPGEMEAHYVDETPRYHAPGHKGLSMKYKTNANTQTQPEHVQDLGASGALPQIPNTEHTARLQNTSTQRSIFRDAKIMNHKSTRNHTGPHDDRISKTRDFLQNKGLLQHNSTLKFKSTAQDIRKQSTDEIKSIHMEAMKSQQSLKRHEASVMMKSAFAESGSVPHKFLDGDRVLHVLPAQPRQMAQLGQHMAQSVQHRALSKKNKQRLSQAQSFRTVGQSGPQERLTLPSTTSATLLNHQRSQKDQMLELLRQQQRRYQLTGHGEHDQSFNFLRTGAAAELSSTAGSNSQDTRRFQSQLHSQVKTFQRIPLQKPTATPDQLQTMQPGKRKALNQYNSESRGDLGPRGRLNDHGAHTPGHRESLYDVSRRSGSAGRPADGRSNNNVSPNFLQDVEDSILTTGAAEQLSVQSPVAKNLLDKLKESSFEVRHNISTQLDDNATGSLNQKSTVTRMQQRPFLVDLERKKIEKAIRILDQKEMKLATNSSEQALACSQVLPALEYFSAIQHSLFQVFLDQSLTTKQEPVPPGTSRAGASAEVNLSTQQLYSKPFLAFLEQICQGMSISRQYLQRNIQMQLSQKEQIIKDQQEEIEELQKQVLEAKAKLIDEDLILSDDRRNEIAEQVREFLSSKAIGEVTKKEKEADDDESAKEEEEMKDIYTLLNDNTYSGVLNDLEAVVVQARQGLGDGSGKNASGVSSFDKNLLNINPHFFEEDLQRHLLRKAKEVQLDTSKRVLRKFYRHFVAEEKETQTDGKEDEYRQELEENNAELRLRLQKLTEDYYGERDANAVLQRKNAGLGDQVAGLGRQGAEANAAIDQLRGSMELEKVKSRQQLEQVVELQSQHKALLERSRQEKSKMIVLEHNVSQLREEQADSQNQIRLTQEGAQGNEERLQEQLSELESELTEMRDRWETEVAYRKTKEGAVADLLAKLRLLEQSNATMTNTIRAKEVALKRFQSTVVSTSALKGLSATVQTDKAISKEVARQQVVLDIPEVFEQSATSSGGGAQFGVADHQSEPNIDAQEDAKTEMRVTAELAETSTEVRAQLLRSEEKKEINGRKASIEAALADSEMPDTSEGWLRSVQQKSKGEDEKKKLQNGDMYVEAAGRSRSPVIPESAWLSKPIGEGGELDSSRRSGRSALRVERDVNMLSITQREALRATQEQEEKQRKGITALISPELDMSKYRYLLEIPRKHLNQTQRQLLDLVEQRRSKIGYVSTPGSLKFNQSSQTQIDQTEILRVMGSYFAGARRGANPNSASKEVQCERYAGDTSYLYKRYGRHIFDFGQTVTEAEIRKCYQIQDMEEKNRRLLYGGTANQSVSPKRRQKVCQQTRTATKNKSLVRGQDNHDKGHRNRQDFGTGMPDSLKQQRSPGLMNEQMLLDGDLIESTHRNSTHRLKVSEQESRTALPAKLKRKSPSPGANQKSQRFRDANAARASHNADLVQQLAGHPPLRNEQTNAGGLGAHQPAGAHGATSLSKSPPGRLGSKEREEAARFADFMLGRQESSQASPGANQGPDSEQVKQLMLNDMQLAHAHSVRSLESLSARQRSSGDQQLSGETPQVMDAKLVCFESIPAKQELAADYGNAGPLASAAPATRALTDLKTQQPTDVYLKGITSLTIKKTKKY